MTSLKEIKDKPSKYFVCKKCGNINWHKNKKCFKCEGKEKKGSENWIKKEYDFWKQEGWGIEQINSLEVKVK